MLHGDLGQPPGGWPAALQKKVLKGETPITVRPGSLLKQADLDAARKPRPREGRRALDEYELASYLMYPKVFTDFAGAARDLRPCRRAADADLFLRHDAGRGDPVEIERGKTLVVRLQTLGDTDEEGQVRVFFELNGQPRIVKVPNRSAAARAKRAARPRTATSHVAAPMPGVVSTVAVNAGQPVKAGDVLLTIEAMKMETALHAERDGTIAELLVQAGDQIDAKDLLVVFAA